MEEFIKQLSQYIAFFIEAIAIIVITVGAGQAIIRLCLSGIHLSDIQKKLIWQNFALWLMLGLEFMLAADIIKTAIAPTWNDLGQLAVIALIRTFLNYFLEEDWKKTTEVNN